jgi:hypothetical protein
MGAPRKALLIDLGTGENSPIVISRFRDIRKYFPGGGDIKGKTDKELSKNGACIRVWTPCGVSQGIAVVDAYDFVSKQPVDLQIPPEEFKRAFGPAKPIGITAQTL